MHIGSPEWRTFMSGAVPPEDETATADRPGARAVGLARLDRQSALLALTAGLALLGLGALGGALIAGWAGDPSRSGIRIALDEDDTSAPGAAGAAMREGAAREASAARIIVVDVAGAVAEPGIRRLSEGDRVADAITAAGGFGPAVDLDAVARSLNLAEPLADGQKVMVPALGRGPTGAAAIDPGQSGSPSGRVDLNRADSTELEALPGIGPVTAGRILEARAKAPFGSVEELRTRGLVSQSVFERIRGSVSVSR